MQTIIKRRSEQNTKMTRRESEEIHRGRHLRRKINISVGNIVTRVIKNEEQNRVQRTNFVVKRSVKRMMSGVDKS